MKKELEKLPCKTQRYNGVVITPDLEALILKLYFVEGITNYNKIAAILGLNYATVGEYFRKELNIHKIKYIPRGSKKQIVEELEESNDSQISLDECKEENVLESLASDLVEIANKLSSFAKDVKL